MAASRPLAQVDPLRAFLQTGPRRPLGFLVAENLSSVKSVKSSQVRSSSYPYRDLFIYILL